MNRIRLNTLLVLLLMGTLLYAQPQGQTPADGETYYIYNVAKKMYLANDGNGKLTLSATGMGVTLVKQDAGNWKFNTAYGSIGTDFLETPSCDGTGTYQTWTLSLVEGTTDRYNIGCYVVENYAFSYLRWSDLLGSLVKLPTMPDATLELAQWLLVSASSPQPVVITLEETATSYEAPQPAGVATVQLGRTLTLNSWNTFCVPFYIPSDQLKAAFGDKCQLAEYTSCDATTLYFTPCDAVQAGFPYLLFPTQERNGDYYEFTGVDHFATGVQTVTHGENYRVSFVPNFAQSTAPAGVYVIRKNEVYHLPQSMAIKGFRGYFQEESGSVSLAKIMIDGIATGISTIETAPQADRVYNLNGQQMRQGTSGLAKGVYIINGKKQVVK